MSAKPLKYIFEGANCPNATGLETFFFHLTKSLYVLLNSLLHFFFGIVFLCVCFCFLFKSSMSCCVCLVITANQMYFLYHFSCQLIEGHYEE